MDVFVQSAFGHGNPFFLGKLKGIFGLEGKMLCSWIRR